MGQRIAKGVLLALIALGCHRPNPAYRPDSGPGAGGASGDGSAGADGGADATQARCTTAADCTGPLPCAAGAWQCLAGTCGIVCPGCTDSDHDGYGTGAGCAGPDCDDGDPVVVPGAVTGCPYGGPPATENVGACRDGSRTCLADGTWTACSGEIVPTGPACTGVADNDCDGTPDQDQLGTFGCGLGECAATAAACSGAVLGVCQPGAPATTTDDCDGKDNDCDGAVDEDCATSCVRVSPNGNDTSADGSASLPFRTIQAAINYAAAVAARPKNVCVAGGQTCLDSNVYQSADGATVTMASGVSVYGNYESIRWTRCPFGSGLPSLNVTIQPRTAAGIQFPSSVTARTAIDGVRVTRFEGGGAATTTAITVDGAKQVWITNVLVTDTPGTSTTTGVSLLNGAEATIARSAITGGSGGTEAIGIRSVGSKLTLRDNCTSFDASGACAGSCLLATNLALRGRVANASAGISAAVLLQDSAGSVIERNTICGGQGATARGLHIAGASDGVVVRGNTIQAMQATAEGHAVWMDACGGASPWIVGNAAIIGDASSATGRTSGVSATGDCHPVVEANVKITAGSDTTPGAASGVSCAGLNGAGSRCAVLDNPLIQAAGDQLHSAQPRGIDCQGGSCVRIAGNIVTGGTGGDVVGISIAGSGPLVERNDVTGGCGITSTIGILAEDAYARIENNLVHGTNCTDGDTTPEVSGVHVHVAAAAAGAGPRETDVHSNTIDAGGVGSCRGAAASLGLGSGAAPSLPLGVFRNNILRAGACQSERYDFWEDTAGVSPRLVENNDLDPTGGPTLYLDSTGAALTLSMVNGRAGASGNVSVNPLFAGAPADLHLGAGSACINAGTVAGAPAVDFDGNPRGAQPDIGAYEKQP